ncbi:MAG: hypothetical protein DA408_04810 [Bacteroidetes bacterium]|nr:MAG: hypothetical protein DA408_04810 [Bacteroidota bacterium]
MRQAFVRFLLWCSLLVSFGSPLLAQNCGQRDTLIFLPNTAGDFSLTISDYVNNNLADPAQGLCAVQVGFVHQFVENFELSLTSPSGQQVNLIGPNSDDNFDFTLGTQWLVSFVACGAVAQPDSAFLARWDNTQTENWQNFGRYTGSYYPFNGCLEDFNTGPVNGTWTFNATNNPSNNSGAITYVRLTFCDSRGVACCFAQGGEWRNANIVTCTGEDTLLVSPRLAFPAGRADTLQYGYGFLLARNGVYERLDSTIDLRTAPAGVYDICGISYLRSDLDSLPLPDGSLTLDSIRNNLTGLEPWFCADLTPACMRITIVDPPATTQLTERICRGDSLVIGTTVFFDTGNFQVTLDNYAGCDSLVTLNLFVQESPRITLEQTICFGDTVFVGNRPYFTTGTYQDTLTTTELGCDSLVTLNLVVLSQQLNALTPVICAGESFMVGDSVLTTTGSYQVLLTSAAGCDSLVQVDLLVLDPRAVITGGGILSCQNPALTLGTQDSSPPGALTFRWLNMGNTELGNLSTLTVDTTGSYILEVSQTVAGVTCLARDTIQIGRNFDTPIADAGLPDTLNCGVNQLTLGGPQTSLGPAYRYRWQTTNGVLGPVADQPTMLINTPGAYQLIVRDTFSGCADTASVNVALDRQLPAVVTGPGFTINCAVRADTLDGRASLLNASYSAVWTGPCIQHPPGPGWVVANCPGWYNLTVTNNNNACSATDSVQVFEDLQPAIARLAIPDTLTCARLEVGLNAALSTPVGNLDFSWRGPAATTSNQAAILVDAPGNYQVIAIRQDNFCRDTAAVVVAQDTLAPLAVASAGGVLNCYEATRVVGGGNTVTGPQYTYQWYTGAAPISGATADTLVVTTTGNYVLEVLDNNNGCTSRDSVAITEDFLTPEEVEAGPGQVLNCAGDIVQLTPDSTVFSRQVSWLWSGPCVVPTPDEWVLNTDCAGLYTLTVTNLDNGCQGADTTRVSLSNNFSIAQLPDTVYLSCSTGTAVLTTTGTIGSVSQWFLNDVLISLPNNDPEVAETGVYQLVVSDFNRICTDTATAVVLRDCRVVAMIDPPAAITCRDQSTVLNGSNSLFGDTPTYAWTGPAAGCIITDTTAAQVEVVCPGLYQLVVAQNLFGLRDTASVWVTLDTLSPIIGTTGNQVITCRDTIATLSGMVAGDPNDYTFAWTSFVSNDTLSLLPTVSTQTAGTYSWQVEGVDNGCRTSSIVQVTRNTSPPAIAFGSNVFPCMAAEFNLRAFVNPMAGNYSYQWSGPGILAAADSLQTLVNALGTYLFSVNDLGSGCSATDSVTVVEQVCVPCLELLPFDSLDCATAEVLLAATFCLPCDGCTLQWSDANGPIPAANNLGLLVNTPGIYTLLATDTLGFSNTLTAEVVQLLEPPALDLGPDRLLTCDSTTLTLLNLANSSDSLVVATWQRLGAGALPPSGAGLVVDEPGDYVLTLTNSRTACSASDTIRIGINQTAPVAEAGATTQLNCGSAVVALDGTGSTLAGVQYQWQGPAANCLTGATTLNPLVSCPGRYTLTVRSSSNGCAAQDTVRVTQDEALPVLVPLPDTLLTCAAPAIDLRAALPATGNFDFRWCPVNAQGEDVSNLCSFNLNLLVNTPGRYRFSATNTSTGCANSFIVAVGLDTLPPSVDAGQTDTLFCNLASLVLNGTAAVNTTPSWVAVPPAPIQDSLSLNPTITAAGWYFLAVTSGVNGCRATDSVFVAQDAAMPTLTAGPDTVLNCFNPQLRLRATGTTTSGSASWRWTTTNGLLVGGATTPTPIVAAPGTYLVNLEDPLSGCQITDSLVVTQDNGLPTASIAAADPLLLTCARDTLLLVATASVSSTGGGLNYQWRALAGQLFPLLTAPQVFTDRPGNYQLIVQDQGNGCRDTVSFSVAANFVAPALELAPAQPLTCSETSTVLAPLVPATASGFDLRWTTATGEIISTGLTATASAPGLYLLRLTDQANGCSSQAAVLVTEEVGRPAVRIAPPLTINCARASVTLDGSGSAQGATYIYQWSGSDGGQLLGNGNGLTDVAGTGGTYVLSVRDTVNGCVGLDSVVVTATGIPITAVSIEVASPACFGDLLGSISLEGVTGGTPPYTYSINGVPFENLSFFEDLPTGDYQLEVKGAEGCRWSETVTLLPATPLEVELGPDVFVTQGDSVRLKPQTNVPVDSFRWNAPGLIPANAGPQPVVLPQETQFVVLTVVDANGCRASDTLRLFVDKRLPVYVPTAFAPYGGGPNSRFTIFGNQDVLLIRHLRIFNRWGGLVFDRENFPPNDPALGWDGYLSGEELNAGVFIYAAEILFLDGRVERLTGDVVLIR